MERDIVLKHTRDIYKMRYVQTTDQDAAHWKARASKNGVLGDMVILLQTGYGDMLKSLQTFRTFNSKYF